MGPASRRYRAGFHHADSAETAEGDGGRPVPSAAQDIRVGGRITKTEFQSRCRTPIWPNSTSGRRILEKLKPCRCCATSPPTADGRHDPTLTIDRDQAARFGVQPQVIDDTLYDAFGQRQIAQYFFR